MEQLQANVVAYIYIRFLFNTRMALSTVTSQLLLLKVFSVNLQDTENVFSSFKDTLSLGHLWLSSGQDSALLLQGVSGSIPGRRTKIPHALQGSQKKKKKFCLEQFSLVKVYNNSNHLTPSSIHFSLLSFYLFLFCWQYNSMSYQRKPGFMLNLMNTFESCQVAV